MADRVGEQFGNYRLTQLLGQGGFAEVYLGEHIHLGSQVAIKVLHTKYISREQDDFLREARTIAALDHPSIIRVFDCGIERGEPFLIMSYAPYGTLRQRYPKGSQVSLLNVISYVQQIASALQYAHDRKVIHRDIKPANILLGRNEEALLSDFGIALISSSSSSQSTKAAAGTVSYMAPEQIMGKPRAASDQYALGIVVYEWLCGSLPFHGSFPEMCAQHLYAPPPSLREKNSTIPPAVEGVVRKALAKEPAHRFSSVQEFVIALVQSSQQTIPLFPSPSSLSVSQDTSTFIKPRVDAPVVLSTGDNALTFVKSSLDTSNTHHTGEGRFTIHTVDDASTFIKPRVGASPGLESIVIPPLAPPSPWRRRSKRSLIAVVCLLALALLVASPFLYTMISASLLGSTIVVTKQPLSTPSGHTPPQISHTPTLQSTQQAAPLTPTSQSTQQATQQPTQPSVVQPVQHQVSAKQSQSQTANVTGTGTDPGTSAKGTLTIYGYSGPAVTFSVGTVLSNTYSNVPNIQMMIDIAVTLPARAGAPSQVSTSAHVVQTGTIGNIGVTQFGHNSAIDPSTNRPYWSAENDMPFSGGQNGQKYTYVQQSDIDGVASPLKTSTTQQATNGLQSQLKSNEHLVGSPQCSSTISSDHAVNDRTATVTVTVTTTCTGTAST